MISKTWHCTFVDVVSDHARTKSQQKAYIYLGNDGLIQEVCHFETLHQKAMAIAGFLREKTRFGDRALLIYSAGMPFIYAFMGCLYAGVIAVPVFPPANVDMLKRLKRIKNDAAPQIILTDSSVAKLLQSDPGEYAAFCKPLLVDTQQLGERWTRNYQPLTIGADDVAYLQYTSGSTGHPKGVMVTHRNILSNVAMIERWSEQKASCSITVGWLPHFHDMGLVSLILFPCFVGFTSVIMSPQRFMRMPLTWLKAISDFRGTNTTAPNFAYERCVRFAARLGEEKLDLSCLEVALNGAEPIRAETMERFYHAFKSHGFKQESFCPAFGLAETTVFVTGTPKAKSPTALLINQELLARENKIQLDPHGTALVGHGKTDVSHQLVIVHPESFLPCEPGQVGEIWLKGASVCAGYWNKPKETRETFHARLKDGRGPFLRTGDLGFFHDDELYITGRLKDLIIIQGRNYYPQDIEEAVRNLSPKIRSDRVITFSVERDGAESICIVAEYKGKPAGINQLFGEMNQTLGRMLGIKIDRLILIRPKTMLLTTSGKVRRKDTQKAFLAGGLEVIADASTPFHPSSADSKNDPGLMAQTAEKIKTIVAGHLKISVNEVDEQIPLGQYGLTSMDAYELASELESVIGRPFSPTLIYANPTIQSLAAWVLGGPSPTSEKQQKPALSDNGGRKDPIAIIGMACNFPAAPDVNAFWRILERGIHAVTSIPEDRPFLDAEELAKQSPGCGWGAFIGDAAEFDAEFFNIPPAEAQWMDPQHRKLLESVWAAIENAGDAPSHLAGSATGVFIGVSAQDYHLLISRHGKSARMFAATGLSNAMLANRISYLLDLHGPSEVIDTACSSSLVAVHRAVQSIRTGDCDQAIVGGVNLLLSPLSYLALGKSGLLSPDGACKTFDAQADGYVRGEGIGVVLLKPLSKALADQDHIHALIKGSALCHGGKTASLTAPNENAQAGLIKKAFHDADVSPRSIDYVELHGTGTALGDPIEVNGLIKAFKLEETEDFEPPLKAYCAMGSVKTNIGHLEAAAGIAGLIKAALVLNHRTIPATINFKKQNPLIHLEKTPFYIAAQPHRHSPKKGTDGRFVPMRAGVSAFGFGGTYAHVILEEAPVPTVSAAESSGPYLILLSGKTKIALSARIQALYAYLYSNIQKKNASRPALGDVAYTLQTGRDHYRHRIALIAGNHMQLRTLLEEATASSEIAAPALLCVGAPSQSTSKDQFSLLQQMAETWLEGADINWMEVNSPAHGRKIPLPAYPFEKKTYWFAETSQKERISQTPSDSLPSAPRHVSVEEATQWLLDQASDLLGIAVTDIDPESNFGEINLDSIALIGLHDRMQHYFGMALPLSIIQDYPNIRALARLVAVQEIYERPDLHREVAVEMNNLRSLLDQLPEKKKRSGKGPLGRSILLTGATGFLGSFLLSKLLDHTDARIYCLVRAATPDEGFERLQNVYNEFKLENNLSRERVHVICGDLAQTGFGVDSDIYAFLAATIDAVYHSGAVVDWMKPYMSLKKVNVNGTTEAIAFCARGKVKTLHYISSLAVLPLVEGENKWVESDLPDPEGLTNGYAQSKWVAERLCVEARRSGLGVDIFRFDFVAGEIKTGAMKATDFIVRLIKGCIQLGVIPAQEVNFDILAVDYLSDIVILLSRLNRYKTYHLINRQPFSTCDFTRIIRQSGYRLERIEFEAWKEMIKASPACNLYPLSPFISQYTAEDLARYHAARIDNTNTLSALYHIDPDLITRQPAAQEILTQVIRHFSASGEMPRPGHGELLRRQSEYWRRQLSGAPARLDLPYKLPNKDDANTLKKVFFNIPEALGQELTRLALHEEIHISELILAVFQALLCRYCRQTDIPVAIPVIVSPGRERALPFAKISIIRTVLSPGTTLRMVLYYVRQMVREAMANMDGPSDEIGRMLYPEHNGADRILYDTMWIYKDNDQPSDDPLNLSPLTLEDIWQESAGFKFYLEKRDEKFSGTVVYGQHQFTESTIARLTEHFSVFLTHVLRNPNADLFSIPIMPAEELTTIIDTWNDTTANYPVDKPIHELFSNHAACRPEAVALRTASKTMTYGELDRRSDQLAAYLRIQGITTNELIGICADKSFELIIGLLAVFKAGGAYVPIEPSFPQTRKQFMLADANVRILLTQTDQRALIPSTSAKIICIDAEWEQIAAKTTSDASCRKNAASFDLAYMIYTSGSTGTPKGLKVSHSSLVNLMHALSEQMKITPDDCMLTCAALSFDLSVFELFYPLAHGASLALLPRALAGDGQRLRAFLEDHPITFMAASMPTWRLLEYAGWQGNSDIQLVNSGEALPYEMAQTLVKWSKAAFNAYGPAEATVFTTVKRLESSLPVTIGKTLANCQVYIVDEYFNPMPIGAYGELYIGGSGLAWGYHNRPELNREKFIVNPIRPEISPRLYRTGDLACFREDGEIVFKGRADNQIKLRGHRIELGEIEHAVCRNEQVKACLVLARHDPGREKKLAAYIIPAVPPGQINIHRLKRLLKEILPDYMIPSDFVLMDQFPATPGGKVDRNALPIPDTAKLTDAYVAPETTVEVQLSDIWKRILKMDKVGRHNNFLDLGGNSILAMKLLLEINQTFRIDLTIQRLYENLTIAELAKVILDDHGKAGRKAQTHIDLNLEPVFDLEIDINLLEKAAIIPDHLHTLLLTGVTGFLGVYLLQTLLDKTSAKVHCLVRASHDNEGMNRIKNKMKEFWIWKESYQTRIIPVTGDLSKPNLGLTDQTYESLSDRIDAVYHCGSLVNFSYPYSFLKKTNVQGTKEIIRFSFHKRIKHLFHISTASVFEQKGMFSGIKIGEDDPLPEPDGLFSGYTESKWVAEKIIFQAREKGLPITIFRPASVLGHSKNGISNEDDLVSIMIRVFNTINAIPDVDFEMNGLPVDYAADAIVQLSLDPRSQNKNFHVVNTSPVSTKKLIDYYISYGFNLPRVPFKDWLEMLKDAAKVTDFLMPFISVVEYAIAEMSSGAYPTYLLDNTKSLIENYGETVPLVDEKLFHTYLRYFEQINFISPATRVREKNETKEDVEERVMEEIN